MSGPVTTPACRLDDSDHARAALAAAVAEAVAEARPLGVRVDAVVAHEAPTTGATWTRSSPRRRGRRTSTRWGVVRRSSGGGLGPEPVLRDAVRVVAVEGYPGQVLVGEAAGAELLVVGSRSRNQLEGLVLGSVALHCVVHAPCPVLVVHPPPVVASPDEHQQLAARG